MKKIALVLFAILLTMCASGPEPINFGKENCAHCSMTIMNPKFASEFITAKGKIYKFDSIECMLAKTADFKENEIASLWVPNFNNEKEFIKLDEAFILKSDKIKSPMSLNLLAFKDESDLLEMKDKYGGEEISVKEAIEYVQSKW